jgi:hypothetical protein
MVNKKPFKSLSNHRNPFKLPSLKSIMMPNPQPGTSPATVDKQPAKHFTYQRNVTYSATPVIEGDTSTAIECVGLYSERSGLCDVLHLRNGHCLTEIASTATGYKDGTLAKLTEGQLNSLANRRKYGQPLNIPRSELDEIRALELSLETSNPNYREND